MENAIDNHNGIILNDSNLGIIMEHTYDFINPCYTLHALEPLLDKLSAFVDSQDERLMIIEECCVHHLLTDLPIDEDSYEHILITLGMTGLLEDHGIGSVMPILDYINDICYNSVYLGFVGGKLLTVKDH